MASSINGNLVDAFNASGFGGTVSGFLGPVDYPVNNSTTFTWNVAAEYNVADQLRIGLERMVVSKQEVDGNDDEVEHAGAASMRLFAEYLLIPVDPQLLSRYELAIGAGVSCNWLSVDGSISSYYGSAFGETPSLFAADKTVAGAVLRMSLDYYVSRHFSVQGKLEEGIAQKLSVPSVTFVNSFDRSTKTLAAHSVDFSGLDFSVGVRYHL